MQYDYAGFSQTLIEKWINDIHIVFHAYSVYHVPIAEVLIHNAIVLWCMGSHGIKSIIIYII